MANTLLDHFCQEVSYTRLQSEYKLSSIHTAINYVSYLENACLLRLVPKFSFKSIERQTQRKAYAIDNAFITDHDDVLQTDSFGWRLENAIAVELHSSQDQTLQPRDRRSAERLNCHWLYQSDPYNDVGRDGRFGDRRQDYSSCLGNRLALGEIYFVIHFILYTYLPPDLCGKCVQFY